MQEFSAHLSKIAGHQPFPLLLSSIDSYGTQYTLPQNKRNFNFQIYYGDPGPGSVTPGHVEMAFDPIY